jgi:hypothetical protein
MSSSCYAMYVFKENLFDVQLVTMSYQYKEVI